MSEHDHDHGNGHDHDHDHETEPCDASQLDLSQLLDAELDTQAQIFLEMRGQNLELLKIASQVAGYGSGQHPLKTGELRQALKAIWDVYAEFYEWIDPEDSEDIDEDEEEDID